MKCNPIHLIALAALLSAASGNTGPFAPLGTTVIPRVLLKSVECEERPGPGGKLGYSIRYATAPVAPSDRSDPEGSDQTLETHAQTGTRLKPDRKLREELRKFCVALRGIRNKNGAAYVVDLILSTDQRTGERRVIGFARHSKGKIKRYVVAGLLKQ